MLGVSKTASNEEIAKAYRKLARKHHPDLNPDDASAKKKFQEIQTAYDTLNDPEKRKMYDQFGPSYEQMSGGGGGHPGGNPFGGAGGGGSFDFNDVFGGGGGGGRRGGGQGGFGGFDLEDIFRQFGGGGGGGGGRSSARSAQPASDINAEITIPLKLAVTGGTTSLQIDRGGRPEVIEVKIPAGIRDGKKIRLRGQGEKGMGSRAGDLLLMIHFQPHSNFRVEGDNLELKLPITLNEAVNGATVDVPTPGGTVALKVPANSSSGKRLRVRGQGLPKREGGAGDLYIELLIKLPEQIDEPTREAIKALDNAYGQPVRKDIVW